jgi:hypothetical protein
VSGTTRDTSASLECSKGAGQQPQETTATEEAIEAGMPKKWKGGIYGIAGGSLLFRSTSENLWDTMAAMWCLFDPGAKSIFVQ